MTEYDYSPDAYERFQAKMAGVGNWVTQQKQHAPKYSNPFVTEPASSSTPRSRTPPRPESSSRQYEDRPQPTRSRTLPVQIPAGGGYGHTSRTYAHAQQSLGDPNVRHRSARSPQRSGSLQVDPRYASATHVAAPVPHQVVPRASPVSYAPPPGYRTRQVEYSYTPGQPIVLPPPRPGEKYVIIPPKGRRIDVVTDLNTSSSHTRSQSASRSTSRSTGSSSKPGSPTKKSNDALLKRLLTNLTPNVEWGGSGSRSSGRTLKREPGRRRSTSR
ncbi:hypothetical protein BC628DRAFT_1392489 [Trametes gibbosa]|nr:hypothetical protein BC628DRAFT_1392489 [Trametes gibbosa]